VLSIGIIVWTVFLNIAGGKGRRIMQKMAKPFHALQVSRRLFSTVSKQETLQHAEYCMDMLRSQDYDYWLMGLMMPSSAR